jgi:hypothetical protein
LIRDGITTPTARETARRAHLSVRVIFKHFVTLSELRLAAISRIEVQSRGFSAQPICYDDPVERPPQAIHSPPDSNVRNHNAIPESGPDGGK